MLRTRIVAALFALALVGCGSDPTGPDSVSSSLAFNPSNPASGFVPAATLAEQQTLAQDIWTALSAPSCWDASAIVQSSQPVGVVAQFTFYSGTQYRHYGFNVNVGTVLLHQVGTFRGLETAIVETWTGEIEALIVVSANELVHVYPHIDGTLTELHYGPSGGPCL